MSNTEALVFCCLGWLAIFVLFFDVVLFCRLFVVFSEIQTNLKLETETVVKNLQHFKPVFNKDTVSDIGEESWPAFKPISNKDTV